MTRVVLPAPLRTPWERNNRIPALLFETAGGRSDAPRAAMLALHGYTGSKETMQDIAAGLSLRGYAVLAPDLPLHGERALGTDGAFEYPFYGEPEGIVRAFQNALADIGACAEWLRERFGSSVPLGITGYSLGGCLTILAMSRMPGRFAAGVSIVGAAKLAKLLLTSSITADIQQDLLDMGYDEARLEPVLRPVEATERAADVRDLLMFGGEDDVIVPGALVRETFDAFTDDSNELVMFGRCGHFPPLNLVAEYALPFLARRF